MSRGISKCQKREVSGKHSAIVRILRIIHHFFPDYNAMLEKDIADPRNQSYIIYPQKDLINQDVLRNLTGVVSMETMNDAFNSNAAIRNLGILSDDPGLSEMPDWQTVNNDFERISADEMEKLLPEMIGRLICTRQFEKYKAEGMYPVILDGSGIAYFKERHCEHDLVAKVRDEKTGEISIRYYHKVVVAKLVLAPKLVITLGVEFIENEKEDVAKQDCENRAAKRLMERIHRMFPRLPILILGDGLYGVESIIKQCIGYRWGYLLNLKEGVQKRICQDFQDYIDGTDETQTVRDILGKEHGNAVFINGVEKISEKGFPCNCLRYTYKKKEKAGEILMTFQWLTNVTITGKNAEELVKTGRGRWKIENEGFNIQKNGIYRIEHLCSRNGNAMKIHFLVTQIADMFMQLYLAYDDAINFCRTGIKDTARELLISFTDTDAGKEESFIHKKTALHMKNRN